MNHKDEIIRLGIDVHGVADTFPDFFSRLSRELVAHGHEVHVITGTEHTRSLEHYLKDQLGLAWTHLFSVTTHHKKGGTEVTYIDGNPYMDNRIWNRSKAEYCRRNGIQLHIDDSDVYGKYFSTPYARMVDSLAHEEDLLPLSKGGEWHATKAGSEPSIYSAKTTCPLPTVSVEMVLAAFSEGEIQVLLPPKPGRPELRALPFLPFTPSEGGDLEVCATRILNTMTGLTQTWMEQLKTYDEARHLVTSYFALVPEKAVSHRKGDWFPLRKLINGNTPPMSPFHRGVLFDFHERLKGKISYTPIAFALLDERFTWTELRCIYEAVLEKPIDPANFRKMIRTHYTIESLKEKKVKATAGRPPELLTYGGTRDVY
ncbi:NUDIX hydrolase [Desulfoluna spongiiphila]|uniref:NrtR DNA-binding winged helix domain-containing protein n=1 Tax=Desulfoluna spongiiphila TaxID=419481 RepID=A0A1G5EJW4_9BACT|nr:hypothetical protein [Desulfoluna spongiiphila]SCY27081.1 hypothetical protein SAMN05216233_10654 [Desulfoluna spongiiphila]VVS91163.1 nudix hydrolase-like domain superfamily [Desulfoluna spongiiphila]